MKLIGIGVASDALAQASWVPLDDLTVVVGANDAGKSTTLSIVHNALALVHGMAEASTWDVGAGLFDVTLDLGTEVLDALLLRTCQAVAEEGATIRFSLGAREVVLDPHAGPPEGRAIFNFVPQADDPRATWLGFVRVQAGLAERRWDPLFETLRGSSIVELGPVARDGADEVTAWQAGWCLPAATRLTPEVQALAEELGIDLTSLPDAPHGVVPATATHLDDTGIPQAFWVPRETEELGDAMGQAASILAAGARQGYDKAEELGVEPPLEGPSPDVLGDRAIEALTALARAQLPEFVADRYGVFARRSTPENYVLEVTSRVSGRSFALKDLAQGYRLWVQLALFDALSVAQDAAIALARGLVADEPELDSAILDVLHAFALMWKHGADDALVSKLDHLASRWWASKALVDDADGATLALPGFERRPRIYVIDEPEQHLHATLQRRAARWLRDWCRTREVQCLVATHAPAFMALGDGVQYLRVSREPDERVTIQTVDPRALDATSDVAVELGLDRGELLGLHRVVLFVEGSTDAAVLEHLLPDRLRETGVLVCPLHGVAGVRAVPTAQILFRVLRVPFAVLVDNDPDGDVRGLWRRSTEDLRGLSGKRRASEVVHVARMLAAARDEDVEVHPFSIRSKDILSFLAPEAVAQAVELTGRVPEEPWPGLGIALAEHGKSSAEVKFDDFILDRYGVAKDPQLFERAADETRRAGRVPDEAHDLMDELERLSLTVL